jgi:hypothetical protein
LKSVGWKHRRTLPPITPIAVTDAKATGWLEFVAANNTCPDY